MTAHPHPPGASKSGFDLVDTKKLFSTLPVNPGETVLDAGCGEGRYTLPLASRVGSDGLVYAADLWEEGLAVLQEKARESGFANIRVLKADVSHPLPLAWASLDLIFLASVLHDLAEAGQAEGALSEIARLLKPGGRLAVVEFKKVAGPPGPPHRPSAWPPRRWRPWSGRTVLSPARSLNSVRAPIWWSSPGPKFQIYLQRRSGP